MVFVVVALFVFVQAAYGCEDWLRLVWPMRGVGAGWLLYAGSPVSSARCIVGAGALSDCSRAITRLHTRLEERKQKDTHTRS